MESSGQKRQAFTDLPILTQIFGFVKTSFEIIHTSKGNLWKKERRRKRRKRRSV
jgi:hypothetical protein